MTIEIQKSNKTEIALFREGDKFSKVVKAQLLGKQPKPISLDDAQELMETKNLQPYKYIIV